jgi:hypothetical protein
MTSVIATSADAGRSCPYCRFPLKQGAAAERCDACNSLHHQDCWRDGGGCAVLGCVAAGTAVTTAHPPAAPPGAWPGAAYQQGAFTPPPPAAYGYPGAGVPPGYPPPSPPRRSGNPTVLIAAVIVALLGIGTSVLVATGALSSSARTTVNTPAPVAATAAGKPQPVTVSTVPSASEQANDRGAMMAILNTYQSAYSDHDVSALSSIFTPEISRHGLAAGGCTVSHGRGAVLADYQSQFEQGSGSYELVGLSAAEIQLDGRQRAHLDAHYQITPGGEGYVNFRFADVGAGWKISEVYATCD